MAMSGTDIVFVNEIDILEEFQFPYIGQLVLRDILSKKYRCEIVNNKILMKEGIIPQDSDMRNKVDSMADYIAGCRPRIVDFYTVCDTFPLTILMAEQVRKYCPEATIIFGGPQASLLIKECLSLLTCVDIIAYTEGELMIEELVAAILEQKGLEKVPGIAYLQNGIVRVNEGPPLLRAEDLHKYFVRDFAPYKIEKYHEIRLEGGRGCPFGCTFCSTSLFWKRRARMKPIDDLIAEMNYYTKRYGVRKFGMVHDLFTSNKSYVLALCERIKNELDIEWTCSARLDTLDTEMIERMAEAKCTAMYIGIETGSVRMQRLLNKNLNLGRVEMIAGACRDAGIGITFSFIMGFPEETVKDFSDTVTLIEKLLLSMDAKDEIQLHMFSPYPATEETEKAKDVLYFPENKNYLPIIQRSCLFDETEQVIERFPQLCSAYMDFSTEVREKYRCFPAFLEMIAQTKSTLVFSISYLIKEYGLLNLYDRFSEQIEREQFELQDRMLDAEAYNRLMLNRIDYIAAACFKEIDGAEAYIHRCEHIFAGIVMSRQKAFCVIETTVDLKQARDELKIAEGKKKYIFFGGNLKAEILEITNDEYQNQVMEALEGSDYTRIKSEG